MHRSFTHGVPFAFLAGAVVAVVMPDGWWWVGLVVGLGFLARIVGAATVGGGAEGTGPEGPWTPASVIRDER